jgi:hypothetical protein
MGSEMQLLGLAWDCFKSHYPELAGAALQVIGGASVLAKLMNSTSAGSAASAPGSTGFLSKIMGLFNGLALNK